MVTVPLRPAHRSMIAPAATKAVYQEVSFCIPAYNAVDTIGHCIRAAIAEGGEDAEIIVVDNCSTDGTADAARQALAAFGGEGRVVVNERNLGRVGNWNRCLQLARGRWIRFVTTNNRIVDGSTQAMMRVAETNCGFVYSNVLRCEQMPAEFPSMDAMSPMVRYERKEMLRLFAERGNDTHTLDAVLFNGDLIRSQALRFDEKLPYFADFAFVLAMAQYAYGGFCQKMEAVTTVMDMSRLGRYALNGLDRQTYYHEARKCGDMLAQFLRDPVEAQYGDPDYHKSYTFLYQHYLRCYGGRPLSVSETLRLFRGTGYMPVWFPLAYRARKIWRPLVRLAIRARVKAAKVLGLG